MGGGVRQLAEEPSPISRSVTQFKVAFADACLNNLQSTVGFLSLHPLPRLLPPFAHCPLPLTPSQIEASDGRAPRVESSRVGVRFALSVGSSRLSFAQLISAIYKHVTGLPHTQLPLPLLPPSTILFFNDMLNQFSPEGFFLFFTHLHKLVACRKLFTPD